MAETNPEKTIIQPAGTQANPSDKIKSDAEVSPPIYAADGNRNLEADGTDSTSTVDGHIQPARQPKRAMRPTDPLTGQELPLTAHPGYYPGFSTLDQQAFWDKATRDLVLDRVHNLPPIKFFNQHEAILMVAVTNRLLPQDDRDEQHRIPIVNHIDARLYANRIDGYQYESMPPDAEAYRLGLQAIELIAQHLFNRPFIELDPLDQDKVLKTIHDDEPPAGEEIWKRLNVQRFWQLIMSDVVGVYYAHPYAWDEVGFGGPAYPRGYMRMEHGLPEYWEKPEKRYAWDTPPDSLSAEFSPQGGTSDKQSQMGQSGTH